MTQLEHDNMDSGFCFSRETGTLSEEDNDDCSFVILPEGWKHLQVFFFSCYLSEGWK